MLVIIVGDDEGPLDETKEGEIVGLDDGIKEGRGDDGATSGTDVCGILGVGERCDVVGS